MENGNLEFLVGSTAILGTAAWAYFCVRFGNYLADKKLIPYMSKREAEWLSVPRAITIEPGPNAKPINQSQYIR